MFAMREEEGEWKAYYHDFGVFYPYESARRIIVKTGLIESQSFSSVKEAQRLGFEQVNDDTHLKLPIEVRFEVESCQIFST